MLLLLVAGILLASATAAPPRDTCPTVMDAAGIDADNFASFVSHSIHSLTLEDIRFYFKSDASEENSIPTVNADMESDQRVLSHAPLAGYDDDFSTPAMRQFDLVLRNMDRSDWQVRGYSPLEKATHVFHMAELWSKAAEQYDIVEKLLGPESELCGCLTDVENNGIWQFMNLMAIKIRYPGITTGNSTLTDRYLGSRSKRSAYKLSYEISMQNLVGRNLWKRLAEFDFDRSDVELLSDVAEKLVDGSGVMEHELDSAEHWDYWKKMLKTAMRDDLYYDLGVFMYCMLN